MRSGSLFLKAGTKFDAFVNGVLRDGKGPGYANFVKNGQFVQWFRGKEGLSTRRGGSFRRQAAHPSNGALLSPRRPRRFRKRLASPASRV
jgi:hypothetical protein